MTRLCSKMSRGRIAGACWVWLLPILAAQGMTPADSEPPAAPTVLLPRAHVLLASPGAESWPRPELTRGAAALDAVLPLLEHESLIRARRMITAGNEREGEAALREVIALAHEDDLRARARLELAAVLDRRGARDAALGEIDQLLAGPATMLEPWRLHLWRAALLKEAARPLEAAEALAAAAASGPDGRVRATLAFRAGWLHAGEGDTASARRLWMRALDETGPWPELADSVRLALAESWVSAGDWTKALRFLRPFTARAPNAARGRFLLGRALFEAGRADSAEAVLQGLLELADAADPAWLTEARVLLGWLALRRGETARALEYYEAAGSAGPASLPAPRYGTALALAADERHAEAESLLAPGPGVETSHPLHYPWAYALGFVRFQQQRYLEALDALETFRGAVSADSLAIESWSLRGDCLYRLGRAEEASAAYAKAVAGSPNPGESLLRRQALAAIAEEAWGTAARLLGDLILRHPATVHAAEYNFWRGEALYRLERLDLARGAYRRALQQGADPAACSYALGYCAYQEGHFAEALDHFERAARHCRGCSFAADLHLRRGNCLFSLGRVAEAEPAFARAAELAAGDSSAVLGGEATFQRAWSLLRLEEFSEARAIFAAVRERAGDTAAGAEALYWEGVTFFRQELYDQAIERWTALLARRASADSLRARVQLGLGDARFNLGDLRQAIEAYRPVLEAAGASETVRRSAHESLFECRAALEEWEQAQAVLRELEQRFPDAPGLPDRHLQLAEGFQRQGRHQSALEAFGDFLERARTDDPRQLPVRYQMARAREALGERQAAAAAYEALAEHEELRQRDEALLRAGVLRLGLGQPREALRALEKRLSLPLDPAQAALTRAYLAEAYEKLGERAAARNEWEKVASARDSAPDSLRGVAHLRLARMAFEAQEWEAAQLGFAAADSLGLAPGVYRTRYWAGEAAWRNGDTTRAIRWLEAFLAGREPEPLWEATARLRLAEGYAGRGRADEARAQYEAVLRLNLSEEALREEARLRLEGLGRGGRGGRTGDGSP